MKSKRCSITYCTSCATSFKRPIDVKNRLENNLRALLGDSVVSQKIKSKIKSVDCLDRCLKGSVSVELANKEDRQIVEFSPYLEKFKFIEKMDSLVTQLLNSRKK